MDEFTVGRVSNKMEINITYQIINCSKSMNNDKYIIDDYWLSNNLIPKRYIGKLIEFKKFLKNFNNN